MGRISRETRKRTATIVEKQDGTMRYRFPMPDKAHARNALARLPLAKGLSPEEKRMIAARAERILGHSTETTRRILGERAARKALSRVRRRRRF